MATRFTTTTTASATTTANSVALQSAWRDHILTHPNWSLVENYTVGSYIWTVLKCSAAGSGLPADFHLIIGSAGTGTLYFQIAEDYNPTTHVASRFVPGLTQTGVRTFDATTKALTATWTLGNAGPTGATSGPASVIVTALTSTPWFMAVQDDGIVLAMSAPAHIITAGAYRSTLSAADDPMPLVLSNTSTNTASNALASTGAAGSPRHPLLATGTAYSHTVGSPGWAGAANAQTVGAYYALPMWWSFNPFTVPDKLTGPTTLMAEIAVVTEARIANGTTANSVQGALRGYYKHIRALPTPGGAVFGDTVSDGTQRWTYASPNTFLWVATGLAP